MASMQQGPGSARGPEALQQLHFAFAPTLVLASAVQLKVFTHIAEGRQTAADISRAEGATERGTRMLLDALVAMELLKKPNGRYELTPAAAAYLVRSSPDYIGGLVEDGNEMMRPWLHLTEVIRTGNAPHRVNDQKTAEEFFPKLVRSLHVVNREPARRTAQYLGAGNGSSAMRVVDIGCGSGVWGIAIAEADPQARITAQDFPGVLEETKQYIERHGVARQYEFLPGDLKKVDFGVNRFDVALLGNIAHSEGERSTRDLFGRLARALKPGGRIVIIDMIPNDDRTGPAFPVMFALNMLVHTGEGDTFTLAEYRRWLQQAGFAQVETADIGTHSPLVIGRKG